MSTSPRAAASCPTTSRELQSTCLSRSPKMRLFMSQPDTLNVAGKQLVGGGGGSSQQQHQHGPLLSLSQQQQAGLSQQQRSLAGGGFGALAGRGSLVQGSQQHQQAAHVHPLHGSQSLRPYTSGGIGSAQRPHADLAGVLRPATAPSAGQSPTPSQRSLMAQPGSSSWQQHQPQLPQRAMSSLPAAGQPPAFQGLTLGRSPLACPASSQQSHYLLQHQQQQQDPKPLRPARFSSLALADGAPAPSAAGLQLLQASPAPTGSSLQANLVSASCMAPPPAGSGGLASNWSRFSTRPGTAPGGGGGALTSRGGTFRASAQARSLLLPSESQLQQHQQLADTQDNTPAAPSLSQQQPDSMLAAAPSRMLQLSGTPESFLAATQQQQQQQQQRLLPSSFFASSQDVAALGAAPTESYGGSQLHQAGAAETQQATPSGPPKPPPLPAADAADTQTQTQPSPPGRGHHGLAGGAMAGSDAAPRLEEALRQLAPAAAAAHDPQLQDQLVSRITSLEQHCSSMSCIISRDIPQLLQQQADTSKQLEQLAATAAAHSRDDGSRAALEAQLAQLTASVAGFVSEFRRWQQQQHNPVALDLTHAGCQTTPGLLAASSGGAAAATRAPLASGLRQGGRATGQTPAAQPAVSQDACLPLSGGGGGSTPHNSNSLMAFLFPGAGPSQLQAEPDGAAASDRGLRSGSGDGADVSVPLPASAAAQQQAAVAAAYQQHQLLMSCSAAPAPALLMHHHQLGAAAASLARSAPAGNGVRRGSRDRKPSAKRKAAAAVSGGLLVQSREAGAELESQGRPVTRAADLAAARGVQQLRQPEPAAAGAASGAIGGRRGASRGGGAALLLFGEMDEDDDEETDGDGDAAAAAADASLDCDGHGTGRQHGRSRAAESRPKAGAGASGGFGPGSAAAPALELPRGSSRPRLVDDAELAAQVAAQLARHRSKRRRVTAVAAAGGGFGSGCV